ncbi:hypothetical protein J4E06_10135 [Muricauda sp. NFXS6]|uniref:hypothetical protein n=1 Tax=Allomuricauda sp. NFXS6 TaxID=2819094 RepID=UPI0032E056C1
MKKLLGRIIVYGFLMVLVLEILIRVFHLYFEYPIVTLNDNAVVNYVPGQSGSFVVGNRRMHFSDYRINQSGFNSFREFAPTAQDFEVALIGDSFIEGLHQDYDNSIGKKIENNLNRKIAVYEYGFSGNDLADQLHLIHQFKEKMKLIDVIYIYLKFDEDLKRKNYTVHTRANLENSLAFKIKREVKLLSYLKGIGLVAPLTELPGKLMSFVKGGEKEDKTEAVEENKDEEYMENLAILLKTYPMDKEKTVFLIDQANTSQSFLTYCDVWGYRYIDFGTLLKKSDKNTIIKYDPMKHWNDHGRDVVAKVISEDLKNQGNTNTSR